MLAGALLVLWLAFYELGVFLLRIPPDVHDGTLWKRLDGEAGEGDAHGSQS